MVRQGKPVEVLVRTTPTVLRVKLVAPILVMTIMAWVVDALALKNLGETTPTLRAKSFTNLMQVVFSPRKVSMAHPAKVVNTATTVVMANQVKVKVVNPAVMITIMMDPTRINQPLVS